MAASAALRVDFMKGSVSRGNISENDTFMPLMRRLSATISLSTRFFLVPGYVTVARASIINFGYNVIVVYFWCKGTDIAGKNAKKRDEI